MNPIPIFPADDCFRRFQALKQPYHERYYAMYSSVIGGIVTDPTLMLLPVDDHMAHRGDGVFETLKCVDGSIYNMEAHLNRLGSSAKQIHLVSPFTQNETANCVVETVRAGGRQDALIRIFLSRGPGSLGISPYDCPQPALYIVAYAAKPPFMEEHPAGARVISSSIPVKSGFFATIKTVNYLPNVLLKKEAVDQGADFAINFDERGFLAEGATENMGLLTEDRVLSVPHPERVLPGTTMLRVLDLAQQLVADGTLKAIEQADICQDDILKAMEVYIFGTTPNVTAVVHFNGRPIRSGKPGPVYEKLAALLRDDIHHNAHLRTPVPLASTRAE